MTKILSLFAAAALLVAWMLPNHYFPWATALNEFAAFFSALLLSIVILTKPIKLNRSIALFGVLAAIPILQYQAGVIFFWGDALIASLYILGFATMVLVGYNLSLTQQHSQVIYRMLAYVFLIGSILSIYIALRQWLLQANSFWIADLQPGGRPYANLAQPNMLATLLCIGLASTLYLFETRKMQAFAASLTAFFLLFGVALTQSRTPWISAIFAIVFWAWKTRHLTPRLSYKWLIVWALVYALLIFSIPQLNSILDLDVGSLSIKERNLINQRVDIWHQLITAVLNGPLWGYGWNQVSVAQVTISNIAPVSHLVPIIVNTEHSHNILLDMVVWNGPLLGGIIILALATWLIRMTLGTRTLESVFGLLAIGFLLIHAMLEYPLEYAYFLLPAGLIIGMITADQLPVRTFTLPRPIYAFYLVAAGFGYITLWQEYRLIENDARLLRFENAHIGTLKAATVVPDVTQLTQLREYIRFARVKPTNHMSDAQLQTMEEVAHRNPTFFALYRYNFALALNHKPNAPLEMARLRGLYGEELYHRAINQINMDVPKTP